MLLFWKVSLFSMIHECGHWWIWRYLSIQVLYYFISIMFIAYSILLFCFPWLWYFLLYEGSVVIFIPFGPVGLNFTLPNSLCDIGEWISCTLSKIVHVLLTCWLTLSSPPTPFLYWFLFLSTIAFVFLLALFYKHAYFYILSFLHYEVMLSFNIMKCSVQMLIFAWREELNGILLTMLVILELCSIRYLLSSHTICTSIFILWLSFFFKLLP